MRHVWDPRTPIRDWICILALEGKVPTTGPLGKFRPLILISTWLSGSSTDSNHLADFPLTVPYVPHSLSLHHTFLCSIIYFGTHHIWGARCSRGFLSGSDGKESSCNVGDLGSVSESGRSPGGGHGNPAQYSCLENPHGQRVTNSQTWLSTEAHTAQVLHVHTTCFPSKSVKIIEKMTLSFSSSSFTHNRVPSRR